MTPTVGSLFTGLRGWELGLEAVGAEVAWHCETDDYCRQVIDLRAPGIPTFGDVCELDGGTPQVDILCGGFPCSGLSCAGRGGGLDDERSGLWREFRRLIALLHPSAVLIENVDRLLSLHFERLLLDLRWLGYDCEWDIIPAAAVGAPHLRQRIWIVAYPEELSTGRPLAFGRPMRPLGREPEKFPRAGMMRYGGEIIELEPIAPRKTERRDGWSYWTGVNLLSAVGEGGALLPSPTSHANGNSPQNHMRKKAERCGGPRSTITNLEVLARNGFTQPSGALWPTLHGIPKDKYKRVQGPSGNKLGRAVNRVERGILPTPTRADALGGPGTSGREGGANLRTALRSGSLNPDWVGWMMGFPWGYTDLECEQPLYFPWTEEPLPRVASGVKFRRQRLTALGNSLIWQIAALVSASVVASLTAALEEEAAA